MGLLRNILCVRVYACVHVRGTLLKVRVTTPRFQFVSRSYDNNMHVESVLPTNLSSVTLL